jgi:hypothetical protein
VLQLKSAYHDGTTHVVMLPLEFMPRVTALVPRPGLYLMRFHGVLAPYAKRRAAIVPRGCIVRSGGEDPGTLCGKIPTVRTNLRRDNAS